MKNVLMVLITLLTSQVFARSSNTCYEVKDAVYSCAYNKSDELTWESVKESCAVELLDFVDAYQSERAVGQEDCSMTETFIADSGFSIGPVFGYVFFDALIEEYNWYLKNMRNSGEELLGREAYIAKSYDLRDVVVSELSLEEGIKLLVSSAVSQKKSEIEAAKRKAAEQAARAAERAKREDLAKKFLESLEITLD